jgi:hypothetical protein
MCREALKHDLVSHFRRIDRDRSAETLVNAAR